MVKTEEHYKEQIAIEIRRIAELEHNKEAAEQFWKTLDKIKPKSCQVKYGWHSGNNISFTLAYEKGGEENPFNLFIEDIEDKAEIHGFICGLFPTIFYFNPQYTIINDTHTFLKFKLKRNG